MKNYLTLTRQQACRFLLAHQGLRPPYEIESKAGILDFIHHVGCIQFDPLDIVGHNPELVLQARVSGFRPAILQELLYEDRKLLDGWDKMMAIYNIEDWPYFYYRQREAAGRSRRRDSDLIKDVSPVIYKAIEERGPLSSIDLDHDQKVDWSWGSKRLANVALDNMYYLGELVIHHKVHTRKFYDLASRHIPADILSAPDPHPTQEEYHDWHVLRRIRGVGLLWNRTSNALRGIYGMRNRERLSAFSRLIDRGKIIEVDVESIRYPLCMVSQDLPALDNIRETDDGSQHAAIIAPLDNLLWDRDLVEALFGFKYRWEVYKPVADREYGYYVLPVLYGDRFVARFEPGRDKKSQALVIKNWWWEADVERTGEMYNSLKDCFQRFMGYLGMDKISVQKSVVTREGLDWLP